MSLSIIFTEPSAGVDTIRQSLAATGDKWFRWLLVSSAVVAVGCLLEIAETWADLKEWWQQRKNEPTTPRSLKVPVSAAGLLLVIMGVIGEGVFEGLVSMNDTALRAHDEQVLGDTIKQAGYAKISAASAAVAAERADSASTTAVEKSTTAAATASGALKEANSFEKDIVSAKTQAADAETHLADALQRAAKAESEIAKLTGPPYLVPVVNGVATPDLSQGFTQQVLLTGDVRIEQPRLPTMPNGGSITWTLLLDQDSKGNHNPKIVFFPSLGSKLEWEPNTRASFEYITDDKGQTTQRSIPWLNSPIPVKNKK